MRLKRQMLSGILTLSLVTIFSSVSNAQAPPFQHQQILDGVPLPTSLVFLPDNRMLITSLGGNVWISTPYDQLPITFSPYMSLGTQVNVNAEHGLIEILLDPDFVNNNYFYLYWSTINNRNRLSRFVHLNDSASMGSEVVIYETHDQFNGCCHVGGASTFLNDGTILLAVGDDFQPMLAQDMSSSFGKVHRINPDGSVPNDNPYYDATPGPFNTNGVLKTIYASGARNPFRGAYDPVENRFLFGEVGSNDHTTAWEDTHEVSPGANFGWPFCGSVGRDGQGMCTDPVYDDPIKTYHHNGVGASITGGFFYRNGIWPSAWEGRYFYADFVLGWIRYMEFDASGNLIDDQPIVDSSVFPGLTAEFVVKLVQGPDGHMYYITLYDDFVGATGAVHRLVNQANQLPICDTLWATPTFGAGPNMAVEFGGQGTDPENAPITYQWIFDDGTPDASIPNPTHVYSNFGTYNAELIIADSENSVSCGTVEVRVGQPPVAIVTSPSDSSFFEAGQTITFDSWFSDDGPITVADLEWTAVFNHDSHIHPVSGAVGVDTYDLIIPTMGHDYTGNTWYTVTLTATDSDGLQSSSSVRIFPEKRLFTVNSTPPGLEVIVNGLPFFTPYTADHAIGTELIISVPTDQQCSGGNGYLFNQWDGGQPTTFIYQVPSTNSQINAEFLADGQCSYCGIALDFDGVNDVLSVDSLQFDGDLTVEFWLALDPGISATDVILGNTDDLSLDFTAGRLTLDHNGVVLQSSQIISPNQWNHFALVRSGGNWSLYVNGVLDNGAATVAHSANMYVTLVGKSFRPQGLDGSLDEFRIWDIARNPNDIEANMDLSLDPNETGLKVYWSFDQSSSSQNILDISGNNNIGIVGMDLAPAQDDPYFYDPNGPMGRACQRDIPILAQAALEGPYNVNTGLMNDNLRVGGLIPLTEPYSALGYYLPDSGGETIDPSVLATTGPDAIVDWVLLELRNPDAPEIIDESGIGLIQRDGDIVGLDGVNPLVIKVKGPDYNVALRHRNHFGVMTNASVEFGLSGTSVEIDFTDNALITYGTAARKNVGGAMCLWAGNAVGDDILKYSGVNNDRDAILIGIGGSVPTNTVFAYSELDINLDGDVKYAGVNNDRDIILVNIGGSVPTATRAEQLP